MGDQIYFSDGQQRTIQHIVENELGRLEEGSVPKDEEYEEELREILEKVE